MSGNSPTVVHNVGLRRFETETEGALAVLEYSIQGDCVSFDHTHVPAAFRGKGVGAALVRTALTEASLRGWRVIPRCSFVADFLRRHPKFSDVTR
jgi:predicted GNAT family acetyltransferase